MLIHIETQKRVWEHDFKLLFPEISFPEVLTSDMVESYGYAVISYPPHPTCPPASKIIDAGVSLINTEWVAQYEIVPYSFEETSIFQEQLKRHLILSVQKHLDTTAQTRNYDGILSMCSYANSTNPQFLKEAQAGILWRDLVWAYCYNALEEVEANRRTIPTVDELLAELPVINWG